VASEFAPISIGTKTYGSTVFPAARAGLYGLKLSHGAYPLDGVFPCHPAFDSAGFCAKCAQDLAYMLQPIYPLFDVSLCEKPSWQGLRIGFLSHDILQLTSAETESDIAITKAMVSLMLLPNRKKYEC
jgi:Asp-tRNA(Asn)/Glu-tRNA(Gln) amidotransferase A subunit family amidase